jgi:hypothetical protein
MAVNPNIALQGRLPQIENPLVGFGQAMQIQNAQQQNKLAQLMYGEKERSIADEKGFNELYRNALNPDGTTNRNALIAAAAQGGYGSRIPGLQQGFVAEDKAKADIGKVSADTEKLRFETTAKKLDIAGQAFGYVRQNPTLENAHQVLDYLGSNGVFSPEQVAQYKQITASDPTKIAGLAEQAFRSVLSAKDQLMSIQKSNIGGSTDTVGIDPVTGAARTLNSVANTQSPDNAASVANAAAIAAQNDARLRSEGAANRGVQLQGQRLVDERARETNSINQRLGGEKRELELDALRDKAREREVQRATGISKAEGSLALIDKALAHPGLSKATGVQGSLDPRNYIPGTDATNFQVILDQLGGQAFLQAFESLKGGGQITEVEGKKATDAMARLSRRQSTQEFKKSLEDLREVVNVGLSRARSGSPGNPTPPKPASAPAPGTVQGGYRFKGGDPANKANWVKQ